MERRRLRFIGRVQGVGFRAVTRAIAAAHGLTGWVRNDPDGSVEAEAQGDATAIDAFLDELGAAMARQIQGSSQSMISAIPGDAAFEIRR